MHVHRGPGEGGPQAARGAQLLRDEVPFVRARGAHQPGLRTGDSLPVLRQERGAPVRDSQKQRRSRLLDLPCRPLASGQERADEDGAEQDEREPNEEDLSGRERP